MAGFPGEYLCCGKSHKGVFVLLTIYRFLVERSSAYVLSCLEPYSPNSSCRNLLGVQSVLWAIEDCNCVNVCYFRHFVISASSDYLNETMFETLETKAPFAINAMNGRIMWCEVRNTRVCANESRVCNEWNFDLLRGKFLGYFGLLVRPLKTAWTRGCRQVTASGMYTMFRLPGIPCALLSDLTRRDPGSSPSSKLKC